MHNNLSTNVHGYPEATPQAPAEDREVAETIRGRTAPVVPVDLCQCGSVRDADLAYDGGPTLFLRDNAVAALLTTDGVITRNPTAVEIARALSRLGSRASWTLTLPVSRPPMAVGHLLLELARLQDEEDRHVL